MGKPHATNHKGRRGIHRTSGNRNKPFQKVFGNVQEGQGYADKRKRKIINQYRKIRKHMLKEQKEASVKLIVDNHDDNETVETRSTMEEKPQQLKHHRNLNEETETVNVKDDKKGKTRDKHKRKMTRFSKVEMEFKQQKLLKEKQAQEAQKIREERTLALEKYKSKKRARHKKLSQKSKKGQPIMKYHVEHLLQKIRSEKV